MPSDKKPNPPDATAHELAKTNKRVTLLERAMASMNTRVSTLEADVTPDLPPGITAQLDALRRALSTSTTALEAAVSSVNSLGKGA